MHPLAALVYFQLKYCERCGGLWLRPDGAATPYCRNCERIMAALPVRARRAGRRNVPAPCVSAALALVLTVAGVARLIAECIV